MSDGGAFGLRAAAVDIGTNTVLLSIAERREGGIVALEERAEITRLGAGVDASRTLTAAACARTLACLRDYAETIARHSVSRIDVVGTSALRDACGAEPFLDDAERVLGVRPRVIAGEEEARLTFVGATSGLGLEGEVLVFDVGGGSTEIVRGRVGAAVESSVSLELGSVRLFERCVRHDPPSDDELGRVRALVRAELRGLEVGPHAALVGVAGTVTSLAAIQRSATLHAPGQVHGTRLARVEIAELCSRLARLPLGERLGLAGLDSGRADVIVVGAVIVDEISAWSGDAGLWVSDRGVRWGLLEELLAEKTG